MEGLGRHRPVSLGHKDVRGRSLFALQTSQRAYLVALHRAHRVWKFTVLVSIVGQPQSRADDGGSLHGQPSLLVGGEKVAARRKCAAWSETRFALAPVRPVEC